jgi:hypothetical protein
MYIDSELIRGIALLIIFLMALVVVFGTIIIMVLSTIQRHLSKFLRLYMDYVGSKNIINHRR